MSSLPTDYHATVLKTLRQIIAYLTSTLALFPTSPVAAPRPLRQSIRGSLSHLLTCAEGIYALRLAQGFRDEAVLADVVARLADGPGGGGGSSGEETDWSIVSDEEWEAEALELRDLGECWVLLLGEFTKRVGWYRWSMVR
ncbi:hypothetical protein C7212DRAFT_363978 [Tuber magnatum]|uniref:Uncharacterized protein n=1 Tax=Tuber magnatum TaxID=42249 RepID=A0A317SNZ7_9PEZI|nr:hypothetical protein C7212DRAFT_363978 [Tuber magnatum]